MKPIILHVAICLTLTINSVQSEAQYLTPPSPTILDMEWSPDSKLIAIADTDGARILDYASGQELVTLSILSTPAWEIAWSPDGTRIAVSEHDGQISIFQAMSGSSLGHLIGHNSPVASLDWSSDGEYLISSTGTQLELSVRMWDADQFIETDSQTDFTVPAHVEFGYDNTQIYLASTLDGIMRFNSIDLSETTIFNSEFLGFANSTIYDLALRSNDQLMAFAASSGRVYTWDTQTNTEIQRFEGHTEAATSVDWSPDGSQIVSVSSDSTLRIWDATTGLPIDVIQLPGKGYTVDWSPDGAKIAYGGENLGGAGAPLPIIQLPTSNAGTDQTVGTLNSTASVTLDGSGSSDADGSIVSYVWTDSSGAQVATGVSPTVELPVGVHTLTLTVTDDDGATASDDVVITVVGD